MSGDASGRAKSGQWAPIAEQPTKLAGAQKDSQQITVDGELVRKRIAGVDVKEVHLAIRSRRRHWTVRNGRRLTIASTSC
jgi:hypothetical protein